MSVHRKLIVEKHYVLEIILVITYFGNLLEEGQCFAQQKLVLQVSGDKLLQCIYYYYHKQNNGIFNVCSVI